MGKTTKTAGRAAKPAVKAGPGPLVSPLAPKSLPALPPLAGVRLATGSAGIKYKERTDVLLAILAPGTQVAGVFTRSKTASAPVDWCKAQAKNGEARALDGPVSVSGLLESLGLEGRKVAVERNEAIVPRSRYAETWLAAGDSLEIVHFIGGG